MTLVEVENKKSETRMQATQNNNSSGAAKANLPRQENEGQYRDIIADKIGFKSGREAERAMCAVKKIDELN